MYFFLDRSCSCDPKEKVEEWVKEMGRLFCTHYTQHTDDHPGKHMDFARKRLQLAEGLYYKWLENILLEERKKKPDLDLTVLISTHIFHFIPDFCDVILHIFFESICIENHGTLVISVLCGVKPGLFFCVKNILRGKQWIQER